jgi:type II secretory pathway component GspD/PulD (secretin)
MTNIVTKIIILSLVSFISLSASAEKTKKIPFIEFKQTKVQDAITLLSEIADINIIATQEAGQVMVTFKMKNIDVKGAIDTLSRVSGLWYRYVRESNSYLIMTAEQYQSDIVVFRDDLLRTFEMRHQNVKAAAKTISNLYGERVILTLEEDDDDFDGLPFATIKEAIVDDNDDNNNDNNRIIFDNSDSQNNQSNKPVLNGDFLATLGSFVGDKEKQKALLTKGQLSSLQGQEVVDGQQVAKVTDTQTPIYVTINRIHNLLFVRTTDADALEEISKIIESSDKPTPQVLLELEIIEVVIDDSYDQEFKLGFNSAGKIDGYSMQNPAGDAANTSPYDIKTDSFGIDLSSPKDANNVLPLAALLRGENVHSLLSGAAGGSYNFLSDQINASISLLKKEGKARTLSKPVILASNNRQANIFLGDEQIIAIGIENSNSQTLVGNNSSVTTRTGTQVETERRKIGNSLYLLPSINADRTVTIDILQDQASIVRNGAKLPYFDKLAQEIKHQVVDAVNQSNIKTVIVAKDGLTVALGGMVQSSSAIKKSKVPFLGDIPFIGVLFRQEHEVNVSTQYVMLITPHIIMTPEEGVEQSRKINGFDYDKNVKNSNVKSFPDYGFENYLALTKFAASALKNNEAKRSNEKFVVVDSKYISSSSIFPTRGISASVAGAWNMRGTSLYITALNIKNHTPIQQQLSPLLLRGHWLSATFVKNTLNVFSQPGDNSVLYLVSDKPHYEMMTHIKQNLL